MIDNLIYFDHAATTKVSPIAAAEALELMCNCYGNPSSVHHLGLAAEAKLKKARETVAESLGSTLRECSIVFTSGGTEANNLALFGSVDTHRRKGNKILITDAEHPSVYNTAKELAAHGYLVEYIPTVNGKLDLNAAEKMMDETVILISAMLVNNETGSVFDIASLHGLRKQLCPNAILHTDAVQGFTKVPFPLLSTGADLISISGHKIHAPKGVGALFIKNGIRITGRAFGGGQEKSLRSGTEALPSICAFAVAAKQASEQAKANFQTVQNLYDYLKDTLEKNCAEVKRTESEAHSPYIASIIIPFIRSEVMLRFLSDKGICVSAGSACSSKHMDNRVLTSYGLNSADIDSTLRISFSEENTSSEIDTLVSCLREGMDTLIPVKFFTRK
jgi:Cysteine sulfinate desulfinase/cysteine desulfurase and related enzymes